jgi:hypothetical protein
MSIPVAIEKLKDETSRFALAPYLLTVTDDARPHAVAVAATWEGGALAMDVGKRSAANAAARPEVSRRREAGLQRGLRADPALSGQR